MEEKSYTELSVRFVGSIYGIWNLDFFRTVIPICLNITPLQALVLDYAVAFYPLLLVIVTYILISLHSRDIRVVVFMWKPFHKLFHSFNNDWSNLEGSVIKAFATFLMLSYLKILNVTSDLLVYTEKYILYTFKWTKLPNQVRSVYYDASVKYFKGNHLLLWSLCSNYRNIHCYLTIITYPTRCFQKCLNHCSIQRQSVDMFVNCFQDYYKDGTNGTRDCRCFSIVFFLLQIVLVVLFTLLKNFQYYVPIGAMILMSAMFAIFK